MMSLAESGSKGTIAWNVTSLLNPYAAGRQRSHRRHPVLVRSTACRPWWVTPDNDWPPWQGRSNTIRFRLGTEYSFRALHAAYEKLLYL